MTIGLGLGVSFSGAVPQSTFLALFSPKNQLKIKKAFKAETKRFDQSFFRSKEAKRLFLNRKSEIQKLRKQGFTEQQSKFILESKIMKAEKIGRKR